MAMQIKAKTWRHFAASEKEIESERARVEERSRGSGSVCNWE